MSFPEDFLKKLAKEKELTDGEEVVFVALFGKGKTRIEIQTGLHRSDTAISSTLTDVYSKFSISGNGPGKEIRLRKYLDQLYKDWQDKQRATNGNDQQLNNELQPKDEILQQVRERCCQKILKHYRMMRLPSGVEIRVDQLYVDVWLLNRSPRTFQVSPSKFLQTFDLRNDRLGLGERIQRNPGFDVANENAKLVILGKPGAGKTTFLKHLAVDWCKGKFQMDLITVWIEFRGIGDGQWGLIYEIEQKLGLKNWDKIRNLKEELSNQEKKLSDLKTQNSIKLKDIEEKLSKLQTKVSDLRQKQFKKLKSELQELESKEIKLQLEDLKRKKQEIERQLEKLKPEREKFNLEEQLEELNLEQQSKEKEIQVLEQELKDLPLKFLLEQGKLLILMDGLDELPTDKLRRSVQNQLCQLVKDYPKNRFILTCRTQIIESIPVGFTLVEVADFSTKQVKKFVQKWFIANRKSSREAVQQWKRFDNIVTNNDALKELTVTPVLLNLMCLVFHDNGEMPSEVNWLYNKGIKLLLEKWNDAKNIEGWEVGIETYRQLSVERKKALLIEIAARKFENPENFVLFEQEEIIGYITKFLNCANFTAAVGVLKAIEAQHGLLIERADELWSFSHLTFQEYFTIQWLTSLPSEQLAERVANQQWQKVIKQLVKSQQPADRLVQLIKQAIDQSIKSEPELQKFLIWVFQKSKSSLAKYKPAAIRAFYFSLDHDQDGDIDRDLALDRDYNFDLARDLDSNIEVALDLDIDLDLVRIRDIGYNLNFHTACNDKVYYDTDFDQARCQIFVLTSNLARHALDPQLANRLELVTKALPDLKTKNQKFQRWWQVNGTQWSEQVRRIMIDHRNISHDWQFSDKQKQQLKGYYNANKFLVDLIHIQGSVSDKIRTEIEYTLLG